MNKKIVPVLSSVIQHGQFLARKHNYLLIRANIHIYMYIRYSYSPILLTTHSSEAQNNIHNTNTLKAIYFCKLIIPFNLVDIGMVKWQETLSHINVWHCHFLQYMKIYLVILTTQEGSQVELWCSLAHNNEVPVRNSLYDPEVVSGVLTYIADDKTSLHQLVSIALRQYLKMNG